MKLFRRFVGRLAGSPIVFDGLRWVLEGGFGEHRKLIREHLHFNSDRVLDCGCGTGIYAPLFPADKYIGIDISSEYIAAARRRCPNHEFRVLDATALNLDAGSIGAGILSGVMHHLDDSTAKRVCSELHRVLRPNGRLLVWEDVPTRSKLNLIGGLAHRLDLGEHIRTSAGYRKILADQFDIRAETAMRSGFMDYSVFLCRRIDSAPCSTAKQAFQQALAEKSVSSVRSGDNGH